MSGDYTFEAMESPDYLLRLADGRKIGLEITRLANPVDEAHVAEIRRFREEIEEALRRNGLNVFLMISFEDSDPNVKNSRKRANTIAAIVEAIQRTGKSGTAPFFLFKGDLIDMGLSGIDEVSISPCDEPTIADAYWSWGKNVRSVIENAVRDKERLLPSYKINCGDSDEFWLLMVSQVSPTELRLKNVIEDISISSTFDRVYFFDFKEKASARLDRAK